MTAKEIITHLACKYDGQWDVIFEKIRMKEELSEEEVLQSIYQVKNNYNLQCITLIDDNYPERLKQGYKPPFVLFYTGNIELLDEDNLTGIVGTSIKGIKHSVSIEDDYVVIHSGKKQLKLKTTLHSKDEASLHKLFASICSKIVFNKRIEKQHDMETVTYALNNGVDVYVSPTTKSSLNNELIKQGAYLFDSVTDLQD